MCHVLRKRNSLLQIYPHTHIKYRMRLNYSVTVVVNIDFNKIIIEVLVRVYIYTQL